MKIETGIRITEENTQTKVIKFCKEQQQQKKLYIRIQYLIISI